MLGIVSYGFYIPRYRIKTEDIARYWGKNPESIIGSLNIYEKAIGGIDEDTLTMSYQSATMALADNIFDKTKISGVFIGSESHPYVVNPTSTILADYLDIGNNYLAYDTQFACKAATGVLISSFALVKAGFCEYVLVSGSDKATGKPGDALEYSAASAAASFILGKKDVLLEYIDSSSFSSDTPDFWRRHGNKFPSHAGRFTGEPAYFFHVHGAVKALLKKTKRKPQDFSRIVFHMPNGKFPIRCALELGFSKEQIEDSLIVRKLGNAYSACSLIGLCAVLDKSQPGDLILLASYGSGAGSDAFVFRVTKEIEKRRKNFSETIDVKQYVDYQKYLRLMGD